ncbi:hypothetical protein OSL42_26345, partial [Escherichia coli]|nr:hypothetical protein [Escherichia coli]
IDQQLSQQGQRSSKLEMDNEKYIADRKKNEEKKQKIQSELESLQKEIESQVHVFRTEDRKLESLKNNYQKQEKTLYQAYQYLQ